MRAPDRKSALEELQQCFEAAKTTGVVTDDDLQFLWPRDEVVPDGNGRYIGRLSHCPVARRFRSDAIKPVEYDLPPRQSEKVTHVPNMPDTAAPSPEAPPDATFCPPGMCGS